MTVLEAGGIGAERCVAATRTAVVSSVAEGGDSSTSSMRHTNMKKCKCTINSSQQEVQQQQEV